MRNLSRREFVQLCAATGATLSLTELIKPEIIEAFSGPAGGLPPVVWIQGGSCSGCSIGVLNAVSPDIKTVLTEVISLKFHQTIMAANGDSAMAVLDEVYQQYPGQYFLVVEGGIPVGQGGMYATLGEHGVKPITFEHWVRKMSEKAKAVVAIGACATFGGIPAASVNPTSSKRVTDIVKGVPVINVAGCPPHPDRVLGTVVHAIKYGVPELDEHLRPTMFYGKCVHDLCGRRHHFDKGQFAKTLTDHGCLYKLGCKGPMSYSDCPTRKYNNGTSWCVQANSPCLACVEPSFPDHSSPFFGIIKEYGPAGTPSPKPQHNVIFGGEK